MRPRPASTIAFLICSCFAGACNPLELVGELDKAQKQQAVLDRTDRMLARSRCLAASTATAPANGSRRRYSGRAWDLRFHRRGDRERGRV